MYLKKLLPVISAALRKCRTILYSEQDMYSPLISAVPQNAAIVRSLSIV